ncbi:Nucleotide-binding universal stress protein, UspA family [Microlunatus sagamiharensis]|uniref:Nucleotide-binding universal stress protein, UspA family n=1 Tax=Microlunatus sagamiharensis TaxID=546874 RepID=A0A1H2LLN8_9ACTN|nr:universal stress protein [Microlunatus sagamiharensis]SDU81762.1 Nucleotide-binding universal stress protein, UspA family [Microlunatus sagamiharensis]
MTVAVAHQVSSTSRIALAEAAREASMRQTGLAVLHVVESLDLDIAAANRSGISDEVDRILSESGLDVEWELHLATGEENVASAILGLVETIDAEVLVIGARRRSPVGKFLLGSVTQTLILQADVPVLVVKDRG